jgi:hypothetical protein
MRVLATDLRSMRRLIAAEQLVVARYEIAEASVHDPVVVARLRRMRMQRRGTVSELLTLVDGSELESLAPSEGHVAVVSQDTALAQLRLAEERAAWIYDEAMSDGGMDAHQESFARRILDAQRAIQWFERLAESLGRAPLA